MSGPTKREKKSKESSLAGPEAEVDALLRAAQDDLLLKLRVDSHPISSRAAAASSSSSDALDSELARRFEALRSPPPSGSTTAPPPPPTKHVGRGATAAVDDEWGGILGDDLAARFAALKGSSSGPNPGIQQSDLMTPNLEDSDDEAGTGGGGGDGVSEKEVEKMMQWAMDAARLNPSKGNGGEKDDDDGESTDDDDDDEEEEEEDLNEKKRKEMNKGKPKKKFFIF